MSAKSRIGSFWYELMCRMYKMSAYLCMIIRLLTQNWHMIVPHVNCNAFLVFHFLTLWLTTMWLADTRRTCTKHIAQQVLINSWPPPLSGQNSRHFADENKSVLVQVMAWRPKVHKPLPEPMLTQFIQPQHQGPILLTWFNFNPSMDK